MDKKTPNKELSITVADEAIAIRTNKSDFSATLVRGIVGAVPFVGPLVAEAITAGIPNQKIDRVTTFLEVFELKIKHLEERVIKEEFRSEGFADLLEDALHQASRALSDERKEYIASLLAKGLTEEELSHIEKKKLFSILEQLNDAEIIMLYLNSIEDGMQPQKHRNTYDFMLVKLDPAERSQIEVDKEALAESYRNQLTQFGLMATKETEWKKEVTELGKLLLRYIGLGEQEPADNAHQTSPESPPLG